MRLSRSMPRPLAPMIAAMLLTMAAGCSKPAAPADADAAAGAAFPSDRASQLPRASRLGDLTAFRSIAADTASIVEQGDLRAARVRIKALEVAWDAAEAGLKPRGADDWHLLDRAIDRSLTALRADTPEPAVCKAAMAALLKTFDALQGR
ncbi:MAG: hypothetical protein KGL18_17700 [Burkholderiales bacterium]|nr:hypothetical protein [Burkholderiales bacterium]MDE1927752.1 hypothetical protein [Burkholderiales bacterium]MDE2159146.1 hypothetical protein [Burkholderiales bacterium]MDE2504802.1 hypothetical protein [Burkholderiales bacterium]